MTVPNFSVDLSLDGMKKGISITVTKITINKDQVPCGTKNLSLVLEDIDFHNFPHGAKLIAYEGSDIVLENEFIIIPLAPPIGSHHYRLTVRALDENHEIIGSGQDTQLFPG